MAPEKSRHRISNQATLLATLDEGQVGVEPRLRLHDRVRQPAVALIRIGGIVSFEAVRHRVDLVPSDIVVGSLAVKRCGVGRKRFDKLLM